MKKRCMWRERKARYFMTDIKILRKDPVFQLNLLLWSIMDVPDDNNFRININPILRNEGYTLYAIEKEVLLPSDLSSMEAISPLIKKKFTPSSADLWITHERENTDLVIELKSRGFGSDSDKSVQVIKIMAATADLSVTLGGGDKRPGYFVFITVAEDMEAMLSTLSELKTRLYARKISSASTAIIGIQQSRKGIDLISPQSTQLPSPLGKILCDPATVLQFEDSEDEIVPLYFIPWIPGVAQDQDQESSSEGLQVLTSRLLTHVQEAVGKADISTIVNLKGETLLEKATFGAFEYWRDRDRKRFIKEAIRIIERAMKPFGQKHRGETELKIDLSDEKARDNVMKNIEKFRIEEESNNLSKATIPTLFDHS